MRFTLLSGRVLKLWVLVFVLLAAGVSEAGLFGPSLPSPQDSGGIEGVKKWSGQRIGQAEDAYRKIGHSRYGSPAFWGDEVVYQIQVDRFNNGDFSNDKEVGTFQHKFEKRSDIGLPDYRHGGDLQGIIDRLDYFRHLGVSSLWITPIFRNGNGSYHGYCTSDFTRVDPAFGSNELFRTLVSEAHSRGIRVILDIVVNHMCDSNTKYDDKKTPFQDWAYSQCGDDLDSRYWKGTTEVRGQRELKFAGSFFKPFRSKYFFSRCGHKAGDFASQGNGALYGDFSPLMFDFDTNNWDFQKIFTDLHKWWIAYTDLDGFRVDAAKHVTADFVARFSTEIRAYANSIGKNNFLLVGEVAGSAFEQGLRVGNMRSNIYDPGASSNIPSALKSILWDLKSTYESFPAWSKPGLNAVYDFSQSGSMAEMWRHSRSPLEVKHQIFNGGETDESQCSESYCELNGNGDTRLNWNVLEIHDWPRFALWKASVNQMMGAFAHLATTRGTPVLYYGYEQGFNGDCHADKIDVKSQDARNEISGVCSAGDFNNHARYRQDMFVSGKWRLGSQVPQINMLAGIGKPLRKEKFQNWWDDPYLRTDHALYQSIRKLISIRKSCSALRYGEIHFRAANDNSKGGLLAFSRIDAGIENLVLLNSSDHEIPLKAIFVDAKLNQENGRMWKNLLNGFEQAWVGDLNGGKAIYFQDGFQLQPNSAAIFVDAANVSEYQSAYGAHLCLK